uniref:Bromodomain-containing protein 8 n=1 Tax=Scophthalmus maximus TaxID=52904 RepID=A0A8D3DDU9_SCOMX
MSTTSAEHKLLVIGPTEPWSVREKLCLATSVMKSGDQNWVSVSRAIKPFAEPGRPPDWFSQKHCASKYSELLETTEAPKRKRGEKGEVVETVEDVIVRRLTADRINQLKKLIKETQEKHRKLKREAELIQAGHLDSKLEELWEEILQKKKLEEEEEESKRKSTDSAYQGISFPYKCLVFFRLFWGGVSHFSCSEPWPACSSAALSALCAVCLRVCMDVCVAGAPMLSRLLEAGPAQFSAPLSFMVSADSVPSAPLSAATPLPVDSTASASTGLSTLTSVPTTLCSICRSQPISCCMCAVVDVMVVFVSAEDKVSGLSEEEETYMGDELDLKTVGDIIAIIEDKVQKDKVLHMFLRQCTHPLHSTVVSVVLISLHFSPCLQEMKAANGIYVGRVEDASGTKVDSEINRPEVCGEEDGDGAEGFSSEPDGETEPEPAASESEDGYSLHTASSSLQLHTTADSIASSPASSQFSVCSEDLEALQAHKIWKKAIMLVWRAAANHRYANVFLQPVTDDIAPGYRSIVHRPMDLAAIKKNIETSLIRTTAEFQRDIMLMFQNAVMYNSLDHDVYHMALEMQRDVLEQIQQFLATQLIMETAESGISAKSLRGRESTRKQDSTDKDTVSMSSPAFLLSLFDGGTRGRRCAIEADLKMKK